MQCNVGKADKIIRVILGACIIAGGVYYQSWWGAIGAVPLLTAVMSWCPAYTLFGISSCKK
jgi:Ni,Fe-hydrogenase III small subunit